MSPHVGSWIGRLIGWLDDLSLSQFPKMAGSYTSMMHPSENLFLQHIISLWSPSCKNPILRPPRSYGTAGSRLRLRYPIHLDNSPRDLLSIKTVQPFFACKFQIANVSGPCNRQFCSEATTSSSSSSSGPMHPKLIFYMGNDSIWYWC